MEGTATESVQEVLFRRLPDKDIYYADPTNSEVQMIPTTQNTRYTQAFTSLGGGTSVFLIPAQSGQVQDIVLQFQLQAGTAGSSSNMALPLGWGYSLIKSISYRIAGSSQFFQTGQQSLVHALSRCTADGSRDQLFALGGSAIITDAGFQSSSNYGYVWLDLPWTRPAAPGKPVGVASDLLASQIQIQVELYPLASIVSASNVSAIPSTLQSLSAATFTVQVAQLNSRDDSMAAVKPMQDIVYRQPIEFLNQEQQIALGSNTGSQTALLTGFRNGTLKKVMCWLTRNSEQVQSNTSAVNICKCYAPTSMQLTYAGNVYANYSQGASAVWNIVNATVPPYVSAAPLSYSAPSFSSTPTSNAYSWAELPLSQTFDSLVTGDVLVQEGLSVTNGSMQLVLTTPSAQTDWVLHLSYVYAAALTYKNGTADFVF